MAKFTVPQVESNIDNGVTMEHLDVFKDYMEKMFNDNMEQIQKNLFLLKAAVEGEDKAISHLGAPHEPSDKPPVNANQYDWYFNTVDKTFYMYVRGSWDKIATLSSSVDLSDYYTIEEADEWFLAGTWSNLGELYAVKNGQVVPDARNKVINLIELAELVKDQEDVDRNFLVEFQDELTFEDDRTILYRDPQLELVTLSASVSSINNIVRYSTLIRPYDRINQIQAFFESTFEVEASVEYGFTSKSKGIKFSGTPGQTYKWETIARFETDKLETYIKFTGTAKLETSNDPFGTPSWTTVPMPYEMKLSDLMDTKNRAAIVTFNFAVKPAPKTKIMTIDYLTTPYFVKFRNTSLFNIISKKVDKIHQQKVYNYEMASNGLGGLILRYEPQDVPATAPFGTELFLDLNIKSIEQVLGTQAQNAKFHAIALQNKANVTGAIDFNTLEQIAWRINDNVTDRGRFEYARGWDYYKNMLDQNYLIIVKTADFDGKPIWITKSWTPKTQRPEDLRITKTTIPAGDVWNEYQRYIASEKLVYVNAHNISSVETIASALAAGSTITFHEGIGDHEVTTGYDKQFKITSQGVEVLTNGVHQGYRAYTNWTWEFTVVTGKAFVGEAAAGTGTMRGDEFAEDLSTVNVGPGHETQVLSFTPAGKRDLKDYFGRDEADRLYEFKSHDYSAIPIQTTETIQNGLRYAVIARPAGAQQTPVNGKNKVVIQEHNTVQGGDQVVYGDPATWIFKADGNMLIWDEIRDHAAKGDIMVLTRLKDGNWELDGWEVNRNSDAALATKINLDLSNIQTDAQKQAFINGLKSIGIQTSLFNEFKGILAAPPASPNELDWYILSTDDTIHAYHNGAWHNIGSSSGGTATLSKQQILNMLGITDADLTALKNLSTTLQNKQDTLTLPVLLALLGITQTQLNNLAGLQNLLDGKQDTLTTVTARALVGITAAEIQRLSTLQASLDAKQDTLTKTLTIEFDDGTTEDVLVG